MRPAGPRVSTFGRSIGDNVLKTIVSFVIFGIVASGVLGVRAAAQDAPVVRVFVPASEANRVSGGGDVGVSGGSNDQTVEIMKNLTEREECSRLRVTNRRSRAHFLIEMDRTEGGFFGVASRDNKIAVFDGWGDLIFTNSTRSVGNAVKDACNAIREEVDGGAELVTVGEAEAEG